MKLNQLALRTVPVVAPGDSLADAQELMQSEPLHTVVLVGDGMYFGVYTPADRDSGRVPDGANPADLAVGPYASGLRFVGSPEMTTDAARDLMAKHDIAVLPVVAGRIYKGVVTIADLL